MKYRIVESESGTCRIQTKRGWFFSNWRFLKELRESGGVAKWRVWIGSYAEAYEKCKKLEKDANLRYWYPPLPPPTMPVPHVTQLPKYEPPLAPPYHPGPGAILLNERSQ